jgi:predicted dithiol-disulfide oxidoreductase (DUF899 family)
MSTAPLQPPSIVTRDAWTAARRTLMDQEKALTRERDRLSEARRELPWVAVEKPYTFEGPDGRETLEQLFGERSQLLVYHFMFPDEWEAGCKSCSFWADGYDGIGVHLAHRDVSFVTVARAPLPKLQAFRARMGWRFKWVSSAGGDFNDDFGVSFTPEQIASRQPLYNFGTQAFSVSEAPCVSVFARTGPGEIFLTYQCFARGLDALNPAYQMLDLVPRGRDEGGQSMAWLRLHDAY